MTRKRRRAYTEPALNMDAWAVGTWVEWYTLVDGRLEVEVAREISELVALEVVIIEGMFEFATVTVKHGEDDRPVTYTREMVEQAVLCHPAIG